MQVSSDTNNEWYQAMRFMFTMFIMTHLSSLLGVHPTPPHHVFCFPFLHVNLEQFVFVFLIPQKEEIILKNLH